MSYWKDKKTHKFGRITIYSTKATKDDPVKWYLEVHRNGQYRASFGSNMPTRFLASLEALVRRGLL